MVHFVKPSLAERTVLKSEARKYDWEMRIGLQQISPELWLIHHEKWQVSASCRESSKMHASSVNWLMKRFLFFSCSILVWLRQFKKTFKTCYLILFFFALSAEVEKATDEKTYSNWKWDARGDPFEDPENKFPHTTHQFEKRSFPYRVCHINDYQLWKLIFIFLC